MSGKPASIIDSTSGKVWERVLLVTASARSLPSLIWGAPAVGEVNRSALQSLTKPGGNITGVFLRHTELAEKQVELLREAFPRGTKLAMLWDAVSSHQFVSAEHRARLLGLEVHSRELRDPPYNFDTAIHATGRKGYFACKSINGGAQ